MPNASKGTTVIFGGTSGIGLACKEKFRQEGHSVLTVSRRKKYSQDHYTCDVTDPEQVEAVFKDIANSTTVENIIFSVGDIAEAQPLSSIGTQRFRETLDLCLLSFHNIVRSSFDLIAKTGRSGSYVVISSVAANKIYPGIADYSCAKAALNCYVRNLAAELAPYGARSNTLSPAVVNTPLFEKAPFNEKEAAEWHKLGRIGQPQEVAALVYYLASESGAWVTGQDFKMDGGLLLL